MYMLSELEPAKEITGGPWYGDDGKLDASFIVEMQGVGWRKCVGYYWDEQVSACISYSVRLASCSPHQGVVPGPGDAAHCHLQHVLWHFQNPCSPWNGLQPVQAVMSFIRHQRVCTAIEVLEFVEENKICTLSTPLQPDDMALLLNNLVYDGQLESKEDEEGALLYRPVRPRQGWGKKRGS